MFSWRIKVRWYWTARFWEQSENLWPIPKAAIFQHRTSYGRSAIERTSQNSITVLQDITESIYGKYDAELPVEGREFPSIKRPLPQPKPQPPPAPTQKRPTVRLTTHHPTKGMSPSKHGCAPEPRIALSPHAMAQPGTNVMTNHRLSLSNYTRPTNPNRFSSISPDLAPNTPPTTHQPILASVHLRTHRTPHTISNIPRMTLNDYPSISSDPDPLQAGATKEEFLKDIAELWEYRNTIFMSHEHGPIDAWTRNLFACMSRIVSYKRTKFESRRLLEYLLADFRPQKVKAWSPRMLTEWTDYIIHRAVHAGDGKLVDRRLQYCRYSKHRNM